VPAVEGAVYRPVVVTVPPVAFHATLVLLVPNTDAVNCCCPPVRIVAVPGETEIDTWVGCETLIVAEDDLLESAELVAVTVYVPLNEGAVYRPLLVTVPPEVFQVTAVSIVPLTDAVNWVCCAGCKYAVCGDRDTDTVLDTPPEPNIDIRQLGYWEPVHHLAGKEVRAVW
jgi:hypothetical protein